MRRPLRAIPAMVAMLLLPCPGRAIDEWKSGDGRYSLSLMGSERLTGAYLHYPDLPVLYPDGDDGLAASVTRLMMEGHLGELVTYEGNLFLNFSRTPAIMDISAFATVGSFETPYRTRYLTGTFWNEGTVKGRGGVDRLAFTFDIAPVKISVGRQPVNYSVTRIFTPNDFFAPFSTTAINTIYKPGVDAVRVSVAPGMLSTVELTGVLGNTDRLFGYSGDDRPSWGESALLLHAQTVFLNVEWALMGGKPAERWVAGASLQASAGMVNIRAEGHAGFPDTDGDLALNDLDGDGRRMDGFFARLATGFDLLFNWHNASVGCEYQYLSDGAKGTNRYIEKAQHFYPDDQHYLARHYLGISLAGEIIPILKVMVLGLINAQDHSGLAVMSVIYSITDEADFAAGIMAPWGDRPRASVVTPTLNSEFGQSPLNLFLETRFYF